jgi:membrane protease YdiL (CAAX protease family)
MPRHAAPAEPPLTPGESPLTGAVTRRAPDRREIALTVGLALALNLVPGTVAQWYHLRWGLVLSQALFIAGPALFSIRWFHLDRRALLPLQRPRGLFLPAALVGTLALNHLLNVAGAWHERMLPPPEAYSLFFADLFVYHGPVDFIIVIVVFALVPALCEEVLFRGFLLRGLLGARPSNAWGSTHDPDRPLAIFATANRAIIVQAMIFALFHFDPWRLPEILALGLFLGFLTQRSGSLVPAILAHAFNNALSIGLAAAGQSEAFLGQSARLCSIPCAALFLVAAVLLVHRASTGRPQGRML